MDPLKPRIPKLTPNDPDEALNKVHSQLQNKLVIDPMSSIKGLSPELMLAQAAYGQVMKGYDAGMNIIAPLGEAAQMLGQQEGIDEETALLSGVIGGGASGFAKNGLAGGISGALLGGIQNWLGNMKAEEVKALANFQNDTDMIFDDRTVYAERGGIIQTSGTNRAFTGLNVAPVRAELGEAFTMPDGKIYEVAAEDLHKDQDKDKITDYLPVDGYVFSSQYKLKRSDAENIPLSQDVPIYSEDGRPLNEVKIKYFDKLFRENESEVSLAELALRVRKMYPLSKAIGDPFAEHAKDSNLESRKLILEILVALNEEKRLKDEAKDQQKKLIKNLEQNVNEEMMLQELDAIIMNPDAIPQDEIPDDEMEQVDNMDNEMEEEIKEEEVEEDEEEAEDELPMFSRGGYVNMMAKGGKLKKNPDSKWQQVLDEVAKKMRKKRTPSGLPYGKEMDAIIETAKKMEFIDPVSTIPPKEIEYDSIESSARFPNQWGLTVEEIRDKKKQIEERKSREKAIKDGTVDEGKKHPGDFKNERPPEYIPPGLKGPIPPGIVKPEPPITAEKKPKETIPVPINPDGTNTPIDKEDKEYPYYGEEKKWWEKAVDKIAGQDPESKLNQLLSTGVASAYRKKAGLNTAATVAGVLGTAMQSPEQWTPMDPTYVQAMDENVPQYLREVVTNQTQQDYQNAVDSVKHLPPHLQEMYISKFKDSMFKTNSDAAVRFAERELGMQASKNAAMNDLVNRDIIAKRAYDSDVQSLYNAKIGTIGQITANALTAAGEDKIEELNAKIQGYGGLYTMQANKEMIDIYKEMYAPKKKPDGETDGENPGIFKRKDQTPADQNNPGSNPPPAGTPPASKKDDGQPPITVANPPAPSLIPPTFTASYNPDKRDPLLIKTSPFVKEQKKSDALFFGQKEKNEFSNAQRNLNIPSEEELLNEARLGMFGYESKSGTATGGAHPNYGFNDNSIPRFTKPEEALEYYRANINKYQGLDPNESVRSKSAIENFRFNTGRELERYAYQEYLREFDPTNKTGWQDKSGRWTGRLDKNLSTENFLSNEYRQFQTLSEADRNKFYTTGRDWYYKNTFKDDAFLGKGIGYWDKKTTLDPNDNPDDWFYYDEGKTYYKRGADGSLSPMYGKTWSGRYKERGGDLKPNSTRMAKMFSLFGAESENEAQPLKDIRNEYYAAAEAYANARKMMEADPTNRNKYMEDIMIATKTINDKAIEFKNHELNPMVEVPVYVDSMEKFKKNKKKK